MTADPIQEMAEIVRVATALSHEYRCEVCQAQAWVEVEIMVGEEIDGRRFRLRKALYFCVHDYDQRAANLILAARRIVDHREALYALENAQR